MKLTFDEPGKLGNQIDDLYQEDQSMKDPMLRVWEQNIHFLNGQQTIEWDQYQRRFQHVPMVDRKRARPAVYVTNEIEPVQRVLVSFLTRSKPKTIVYPQDPSVDESVRRAKVGELYLESTWDMDCEYESLVMCANWILATGTVFKKYYWDTTARGQVHFPRQDPPMADEIMGLEDPGMMLQPQAQHWGDVRSAVLSPFQMAVDFQVTDFKAASWVMESTLQKLDWVKEQYSQKLPGFTGLVEEVKAQDNYGRALELDLNMRFQTNMDRGVAPRNSDLVVLHEFYQAPRADMPWNKGAGMPRGRTIVTANKVTLYDGPTRYPDWHNYEACMYEPFMGRFWAKSLVEQLIPIQRRINEINGVILENAQTMANPGWLVAKGAILEGTLVGKNGSVTYWDPVKSMGHEPRQMQGIPLPQQYFNELSMLREKIVYISGSNAVMNGTAPTGVTAAAALQLLLENSQSQHGTLINNWEAFVERCQTKKLKVFQRFCKEPRSDLVKYAKRINKNITSLDIEAICGDDIEDNVTVKVEAGSSIPKSQAARQNQLMEFAKMGLIDVQNPQNKQEFFAQFGITEFDAVQSAEWEKIRWENGKMLKSEPPYPSVYDQHDLHLMAHIAETQRPSFIEDADDMTKNIFAEHIQWHQMTQQQALMEQQAQQAEQMMMMGGAPPNDQKNKASPDSTNSLPAPAAPPPAPAAPEAPMM